MLPAHISAPQQMTVGVCDVRMMMSCVIFVWLLLRSTCVSPSHHFLSRLSELTHWLLQCLNSFYKLG